MRAIPVFARERIQQLTGQKYLRDCGLFRLLPGGRALGPAAVPSARDPPAANPSVWAQNAAQLRTPGLGAKAGGGPTGRDADRVKGASGSPVRNLQSDDSMIRTSENPCRRLRRGRLASIIPGRPKHQKARETDSNPACALVGLGQRAGIQDEGRLAQQRHASEYRLTIENIYANVKDKRRQQKMRFPSAYPLFPKCPKLREDQDCR